MKDDSLLGTRRLGTLIAIGGHGGVSRLTIGVQIARATRRLAHLIGARKGRAALHATRRALITAYGYGRSCTGTLASRSRIAPQFQWL